MNLGREHWTRLASGLKRAAPSLIDVSSEEFVELKPSITTLLDFFHIKSVSFSVIVGPIVVPTMLYQTDPQLYLPVTHIWANWIYFQICNPLSTVFSFLIFPWVTLTHLVGGSISRKLERHEESENNLISKIPMLKRSNFKRKKMTSKALRIEKPVRRPIVPPISPNWASNVT